MQIFKNVKLIWGTSKTIKIVFYFALCGKVLSLSFVPVLVAFDMEQLMALEPVLSSVKWEE